MLDTKRKVEADRVHAVRALNILDTPREASFDRLVFIAAQAFRVPMAAVVLVDSDRQWFKAQVGLPVWQTPRSHMLCNLAMHSDRPLVIEDVSAETRFRDNPWVTERPMVRFYAGAAIAGPGGARVGSLCVLDRAAHGATEAQVRMLRQLAEETSAMLIARAARQAEWPGYAAA